MTVHIPRRPYARALPGIPTIRPFEALACGIPLISAPWDDCENLFRPGRDFLFARDGARDDRAAASRPVGRRSCAREPRASGLETIRARHTCAHRVDELLAHRAASNGAAAAEECAECRSRSSVRAWCRPIGTARPHTTAASCARLHARGHRITFYEPDAYGASSTATSKIRHGREVVVYPATAKRRCTRAVEAARGADLIVKASGVGVFDELLEAAVLELQDRLATWWRSGTWMRRPRSTACISNPRDPFRRADPALRRDLHLRRRRSRGVRVQRAGRAAVRADLQRARSGDALSRCRPTRASRATSASSAIACPIARRAWRSSSSSRPRNCRTAVSCWAAPAGATSRRRANVRYFDHVYTRDHNAFNCTPRAVLNISRESMARYGFSPATRVFEAAGAGACLITDAWEGIELFLEPGREVLVAHDGDEVAEHLLRSLTPERAPAIGQAALPARARASTRTRTGPRRWKRVLEGKMAVRELRR